MAQAGEELGIDICDEPLATALASHELVASGPLRSSVSSRLRLGGLDRASAVPHFKSLASQIYLYLAAQYGEAEAKQV
jgi:hypothetical protein